MLPSADARTHGNAPAEAQWLPRFHPEFPLHLAFLLRHSVLLRKYHVLLLPETSPALLSMIEKEGKILQIKEQTPTVISK